MFWAVSVLALSSCIEFHGLSFRERELADGMASRSQSDGSQSAEGGSSAASGAGTGLGGLTVRVESATSPHMPPGEAMLDMVAQQHQPPRPPAQAGGVLATLASGTMLVRAAIGMAHLPFVAWQMLTPLGV